MNAEFAKQARDYKRTVAGAFALVEGSALNEKIAGENLFVTRKVDGVMQLVFLRDGKLEAYNSNGKEMPEDLPCHAEMAALLTAAGVKNATIGAELFARPESGTRERVGQVATALASAPERLLLAPFDLIDIEGETLATDDYAAKHERLKKIFKEGKLVKTVPGKAAASKQEVEALYKKIVEEAGSEGIVVHTGSPIVYKVKPRHSIDGVVIGFTTGDDERSEMVRDLLVAVMRTDGLLQQVIAVGNGLTDEQRKELFPRLTAMSVESDYVETDSRNVAFAMVRPEIVVEVSAVDFVTENTAGEPKMNQLLQYADGRYAAVMKTSGAVAQHPVIVRFRDDKSFCETDIRLSQVTDLCDFAEVKALNLHELPESEVIVRKVYVKTQKEKRMVQKFLVWKTNKEQTGRFPAYVLHHTDYSATRKDALKRDIRVSDSLEQINSLLDQFIAENIKKGWEEVMSFIGS